MKQKHMYLLKITEQRTLSLTKTLRAVIDIGLP